MFNGLQENNTGCYNIPIAVNITLTAHDCLGISEILENILEDIENYKDKYFIHTLHKQFHSAEEFWLEEVNNACGNLEDENNNTKEFMKLTQEIMSTEFNMCLLVNRMEFNPLKFQKFKKLAKVEDKDWQWFLNILFDDICTNGNNTCPCE